MFLQVSVILFTGRGGIPACLAGGIPACLAGLWGGVSQHALQVSRPTPKGELEGSGHGGSPGPHLGGLSRSTLRWSPGPDLGGGVCQAHTQGGVSQHALRQTTPADGYCCGRYASYWNAFLFLFFLFC